MERAHIFKNDNNNNDENNQKLIDQNQYATNSEFIVQFQQARSKIIGSTSISATIGCSDQMQQFLIDLTRRFILSIPKQSFNPKQLIPQFIRAESMAHKINEIMKGSLSNSPEEKTGE